MKAHELYNSIAESIYSDLQQGVPFWRKPYFLSAIQARNIATRRPYNGFNVLSAMAYVEKYLVEHPYFIGFQQMKYLGWSLRKGAKGLPITAYNQTEKTNDDGMTTYSRFARVHYVFNIADMDDSESTTKITDMISRIPNVTPRNDAQHIPGLDALVSSMQDAELHIQFNNNYTPCYIPALDIVKMPDITHFNTNDEYYSCLFHEVAHWTRYFDRVPRAELFEGLNGKKEVYAVEELVAELTACFVLARFGVLSVKENTTAYIQAWSKFIKDQQTLFFRAVSYAQKCADYITQFADGTEIDCIEELENA